MAARCWCIVGVGGTLLIYMSAFIFFSISNIPRHPIQRNQLSRFGEIKKERVRNPNKSQKQHIHWCKELKFLDVSDSDKISNLTALASFPGSGNTWLRYLLQQSTGILTGSVYKDYGLLKTGFPAESICNKSVLVVKTHEWGPKSWIHFDRAILLIRDPEKAILAEFNRQGGGHIGFASQDRYKRVKGKYWEQFVQNKLKYWEVMNLSWAKNFTGTIQIVYYSDLVSEVETTLRIILNFLDFKINEETFECALIRKEGIYKRKPKSQFFNPYTSVMYKQIEYIKNKVYKILGRQHYS